MRIEFAPSCPVSIFIAGDYDTARDLCSAFCDQVGLCVTVTETSYIYTGGEEAGVIVGLINYPRFPSDADNIQAIAEELAMILKDGRVTDYSGMEPRKNPRQPIFRDHNCGGCNSGERPCREGNYNSCSWPRARND